MTTSKINKLLNGLKNGAEVSIAQAISRFGFLTENSVTGSISELRREGYSIYANKVNGVVKYRLGTPRRSVVAAGYAAVGRH
jgi:hypothetical protein